MTDTERTFIFQWSAPLVRVRPGTDPTVIYGQMPIEAADEDAAWEIWSGLVDADIFPVGVWALRGRELGLTRLEPFDLDTLPDDWNFVSIDVVDWWESHDE